MFLSNSQNKHNSDRIHSNRPKIVFSIMGIMNSHSHLFGIIFLVSFESIHNIAIHGINLLNEREQTASFCMEY